MNLVQEFGMGRIGLEAHKCLAAEIRSWQDLALLLLGLLGQLDCSLKMASASYPPWDTNKNHSVQRGQLYFLGHPSTAAENWALRVILHAG